MPPGEQSFRLRQGFHLRQGYGGRDGGRAGCKVCDGDGQDGLDAADG